VLFRSPQNPKTPYSQKKGDQILKSKITRPMFLALTTAIGAGTAAEEALELLDE
jgi:hypothetical protein